MHDDRQPCGPRVELKADTLTASILRTHSQCQRGPAWPNITAHQRGEPFLFIPGKYGERIRRSRRRVAGKARAVDYDQRHAGRACRVRSSFARASRLLRGGGAYRDRTDDLMLAKQLLSQLS